MTSKWNAVGLPYIPNLSVQWDSSPRTVVSDTFQLGGYPFTGTFRSTPEEWTNALRAGKQFLDGTCKADGTWCPMTINAWNEVSQHFYRCPANVWLCLGFALYRQCSHVPDGNQPRYICSGARAHTSSLTCVTEWPSWKQSRLYSDPLSRRHHQYHILVCQWGQSVGMLGTASSLGMLGLSGAR